jgi:hypothetical protein
MKRVLAACALVFALVAASAAPADAMGKSGTFRSSKKYTTRGTATIADTKNPVLRFSSRFRTSSGPRLKVYLSSAPVGSKESTFDDDVVVLGSLKRRTGSQSYTVPAGTDLSKYRTVVIWCDKFDVLFGVARLN